VSARRYDFHGVGLEVATADDALAEAIDGRLRHFATAAGAADLRFEYRTGAEHLVERPSGEGRPVYDTAAGDVRYYEDGDQLYMETPGVRVLCRAGEGRTTVSRLESAPEDLWLLSRPMLTLPLLEMLERRGLYGVHAAGVAVGDRAVVLAGPSGSGKSTLAVTLARAGLPLLSDDLVFLSADGGVRVHGFPEEIDVSAQTAGWFPELGSLAGPPPAGWPKHRVRADEVLGAVAAPVCEPGVLIVPTVAGDQPTTVAELAPGEALLELAPNVLLTDRASSQAHLDALGALVRSSRCHRLSVGRDFERIPDVVRQLAA
jgi:hypothetical protein